MAYIGLFCLAGSVHAIGPAGPSWQPRELIAYGLDYTEQNGADRALAFDHFGEPAVAYKGAGIVGDARYARKLPGVGWIGQDIFPSSGSNGRGGYISLAFDRYERPAMSFRSHDEVASSAGLYFSYYDGTDWQSSLIDYENGADIGIWTSLAYDRIGRAAIAYKDATFGHLNFYYDEDGDFDFTDGYPVHVTDFPTSADYGFYISLAFDPLNRPMIVHTTAGGDLRFSTRETVGWVTVDVDDSRTDKSNSSLAIDPDTGYPAIAYSAETNILRFAQWDGNVWDITDVDTAEYIGDVSLAFDPTDGNPTIAYHWYDTEQSMGGLNIGWYDGSTWQTDIVDDGTAGEHVGLNPSIAFREFGDGERVAAISYYDDLTNLWYIEDPPAQVPEPTTLCAMLIAGSGFMLCVRRHQQLHKGH